MTPTIEKGATLNEAINAIKQCLKAHKLAQFDPLSPFLPFPESSPISQLCARFNLSQAEIQILLLCISYERDPIVGQLCGEAQHNLSLACPTPQLVWQLLPEHGKVALSPSGALRYWGMLERDKECLSTAMSLLRLDERILHYVMGTPCLDERLTDAFEPVPFQAVDLPTSQQAIVQGFKMAWDRSTQVFQLCGSGLKLQGVIATHFCNQLGLTLYQVSVEALPTTLSELRVLLRLWRREVKLHDYALLINWDQIHDNADIEKWLLSLIKSAEGPVIVITSERKDLPAISVYTAMVEAPTPAEQRVLWASALNDHSPETTQVIDAIASQFSLTAASIQNAATYAPTNANAKTLKTHLWKACRIQARPQLDTICQRIETKETWEDLILPEEQKQVLEMIIAHNQQRATVYEDWGFAGKSSRGLGTSALFSGPSGTGKTMAANVIAQRLNLDLYKVDLSTVVSKYIGETEKNLKLIFDAAESGGVILLFDEADSIFGKRSEVKDSRDRYANMEVSYLLQRMESYRGLAILTTNMQDSIDAAFIRRIRFITRFPFPTYDQRYEIWQRIFPEGVPQDGLDYHKLARLDAAGGNIRSIALSAAFLAATEGAAEKKKAAVTMDCVYRAAKNEYRKLQQPMPATATKGWLE